MPNRTITTLTDGNVVVIRHADNTASAELREYKRRGRLIYLVREGCVPQPMCRGLSTHGQPLFIRPGEKLEEAIRAALVEHDRANGPTWAQRIGQAFGRRFQQLIGIVR